MGATLHPKYIYYSLYLPRFNLMFVHYSKWKTLQLFIKINEFFFSTIVEYRKLGQLIILWKQFFSSKYSWDIQTIESIWIWKIILIAYLNISCKWKFHWKKLLQFFTTCLFTKHITVDVTMSGQTHSFNECVHFIHILNSVINMNPKILKIYFYKFYE